MRKFKSSKAIKLFAALILFLSSFTYMACSNSTSGASSDDETKTDTPNTPADTGAKNNKSSNDALVRGYMISDGLDSLDPDNSAKHFSKSPSAPGKNVEKVKISNLDSPIPVYIWKDNDTIYYYADTTGKIYLDGYARHMFSLKNFETIDLSSFDTSKVTDMSHMFDTCSKLTSLNLSSFDTSKVTDMSEMFSNCSKLTSLNLSSFNTSNVTNMSKMFLFCSELTSLDLSSFDTSKVTDMSEMFSACNKLTSLNLASFNTSNVTNMRVMFNNCWELTSLNLASFNTSNVTDMSLMFDFCSKLTSLNLSSFNTSNVTNMLQMFNQCKELTSLDLSSFDTSKVTDMYFMFSGNENLTTIEVSENFVTTNVTRDADMFKDCKSLKGGNNTTYNGDHIGKEYARIDKESEPGYFTLKQSQ